MIYDDIDDAIVAIDKAACDGCGVFRGIQIARTDEACLDFTMAPDLHASAALALKSAADRIGWRVRFFSQLAELREPQAVLSPCVGVSVSPHCIGIVVAGRTRHIHESAATTARSTTHILGDWSMPAAVINMHGTVIHPTMTYVTDRLCEIVWSTSSIVIMEGLHEVDRMRRVEAISTTIAQMYAERRIVHHTYATGYQGQGHSEHLWRTGVEQLDTWDQQTISDRWRGHPLQCGDVRVAALAIATGVCGGEYLIAADDTDLLYDRLASAAQRAHHFLCMRRGPI